MIWVLQCDLWSPIGACDGRRILWAEAAPKGLPPIGGIGHLRVGGRKERALIKRIGCGGGYVAIARETDGPFPVQAPTASPPAPPPYPPVTALLSDASSPNNLL